MAIGPEAEERLLRTAIRIKRRSGFSTYKFPHVARETALDWVGRRLRRACALAASHVFSGSFGALGAFT
jgi:hypothetical protein